MPFRDVTPGTLTTFDLDQRLPGGFRLPARMTAVRTEEGFVALVSPIPIDEERAREIAALGEVRWLVAPNLLHHLYLAEAAARYPAAKVLAPRGLVAKRGDLRVDAALEDGVPAELAACLDVLPVLGAPLLDEHAFFHRASRTLIVTDLVFNVREPRGLVANLVLWLVGAHGRLAQSRSWRFFVKDAAAYAASVDRLVALGPTTLVMAHGEIVRERAAERLAKALAPGLRRARPSPALA